MVSTAVVAVAAVETNWKHKVTPDWGDLIMAWFTHTYASLCLNELIQLQTSCTKTYNKLIIHNYQHFDLNNSMLNLWHCDNRWFDTDKYQVINYHIPCLLQQPYIRDQFVYAPIQWETTLHCNVVSHWLGVCSKWFLIYISFQKEQGLGLKSWS